MNPLSLHHLTMLDASAEELVAAAIAGGFDFAGLRIVSPDSGLPFGDLVTDAAARRRIRSAIADLPGGIWDVEAVWITPETDISALRPVWETARELGARYVLTVGNDPDATRMLDRFHAITELSAEVGVGVVVEPITYCVVSNLSHAQRLTTELGGQAGILIDALQFFRSDAAFPQLAEAPPSLFPYAQIADGPRQAPDTLAGLQREARGERMVPGCGDFDLRGLVATLPAGIPLAVETPSAAVRSLPRAEAAKMLHESMTRVLARAVA